MFSDIVSELHVKCHICCQVRVLTNVINVAHRKSHSMCPPLVGGCVGLTKTDVLLNTMLVRYQQWYWSCIDNGVNILYSLDVYRSLVHIYVHTYTKPIAVTLETGCCLAKPQYRLVACAPDVIANMVYIHLVMVAFWMDIFQMMYTLILATLQHFSNCIFE